MKTRDVVATLFLVGSVLFLVSGIVWSSLTVEDPRAAARDSAAGAARERGGESAARPAAGAADSSGNASGARGTIHVERDVERSAIDAADAGDATHSGRECQLSGRVVGPDGQPVELASVRLELRLAPRADGPIGRSEQPVVTAADGRFSFVGERLEHLTLLLLVRAPTLAPQLSEHAFQSGASTLDVGDLELAAGGALFGSIGDAQGLAVEGATATLVVEGSHPLASWSKPSELFDPVPAGASGWYRFDHVTPGPCHVVATAPRMQEGRSRETLRAEEGLETEVDPIHLDRAVELTGRVVAPDDAPIAGAAVRARSRDRGTRFDASAETGADGRFQLDHAPAGALRVDVRAEGFRRRSLDDVDPMKGELVVQMEKGLAAAITVVDAGSGEPIVEFAARIRPVDPNEDPAVSPIERVLARGIRDARRAQSEKGDAEAKTQAPAVTQDLERRLESVRSPAGRSRGPPLRLDVGAVASHPGGRQVFEGLEEGSYAADVSAPGHQPASARVLDVREGEPAPELRVALERGLAVSGVVVRKADGSPIVDAAVELVAVDDDSTGDAKPATEPTSSPFAWAFARPGPHGETIATTKSDALGRFTFSSLPAGPALLIASCDGAIAFQTGPFDLRADRDDFRLLLAPAGSVSGRLRGIPAGRASDVRVFALGGSGTMKTVRAAADATYRIDSLPPGEYVVSAFLGESSRALAERVDAIFASADRAQRCNLELAEGETKALDLVVDVPPLGIVEGSVLVNGTPARGFRVALRSVDLDAGGRPAQAIVDQRGLFTLKDVPAGSYMLQLSTPETRQELDRESLLVVADSVTAVHAVVDAGALHGEVRTHDGQKLDQVEGTLRILPGAKEKPADLRAYARDNRVHEVRVRRGSFADDALTPGHALVLVELKGRPSFETTIDIPARSTCELVLQPPR